MKPCSNDCGKQAVLKGLCRACYRYQKRTGRPRPEETIVAHNIREFEREVERENLCRMVRGQ